jgi:hypothetical protein
VAEISRIRAVRNQTLELPGFRGIRRLGLSYSAVRFAQVATRLRVLRASRR